MPIFEKDSIRVVDKHLHAETLLILDLDNTLIESIFHYGSYQWGGYLIREAIKKGMSEEEALETTMTDWNRAQYEIEMKTIEDEVSGWLNQLHSQGVKILALTARSPQIAQVTHAHLEKHGLKFSDWGAQEMHYGKSAEGYLEKGVLFVGPKNNKGKFLLDFISKLDVTYKKIVFVDDQISYLEQVENSLKGSGIEFIGVRYSRADQRVKSF